MPVELPAAAAILNPHQPGCGYPFRDLAGCGVAYKLVAALKLASTGIYKQQVALLVGTSGSPIKHPAPGAVGCRDPVFEHLLLAGSQLGQARLQQVALLRMHRLDPEKGPQFV